MKVIKIILISASTCLLFYLLVFSARKIEMEGTEEGEIHFRSYFVNVSDTFDCTKRTRVWDTAIYYVKGEKIYRTPYLTEPQLIYSDHSSGNSTVIYEDLSHPGYLMDFTKRKYYVKDSLSNILTKPLDSLLTETLYRGRILKDPKYLVTSIDTIHPIFQNGKILFHGIATYLDKPTIILFRFSKDKLPIASPLNEDFKGVTYPIIEYAVSIGDRHTGKIIRWIVCEVTSVESKHIDDKYFSIPK